MKPLRAIKLMEFGIEHNPDNWQLYYNLGFVYYTELKDYRNAAEVFERGSKVPDAHPFMKIMAAQMAAHAGDFATARMLWSATYETSHEENIRQNAVEHLRSLRVDEDVTRLEAAVSDFSERTGRRPASMAELVVGEHLPGILVDPDGNPYVLSPKDGCWCRTRTSFRSSPRAHRRDTLPGRRSSTTRRRLFFIRACIIGLLTILAFTVAFDFDDAVPRIMCLVSSRL